MKFVACTTGDARQLRALQGNARESIAFDLIISNIEPFFGRHHHPIRTHHFNKKEIYLFVKASSEGSSQNYLHHPKISLFPSIPSGT
jgi:hypothetical protein